jgi:hypothetical protein
MNLSNPNGAETSPLYMGGDQLVSSAGLLGRLQSSNPLEQA